MHRIGLVMCSRLKRPTRFAAGDLYTSSRFLRDRAAVEATCDDWLILSGKYGLIDPDRSIKPYDVNLNNASRLRRFLLSLLIAAQFARRFGLIRQVRVELRAEDAYKECGIVALSWLGFRHYPSDGGSGVPAVLIRSRLERGK
ncbi:MULTISPECIES: DUF6884 domain-containing protein [Sphingomonas]|uniref:DUF6884 domain-containing protein n=1 Tax=Sphingomonas TaxID=13687 RepID=UPI001AE83014